MSLGMVLVKRGDRVKVSNKRNLSIFLTFIFIILIYLLVIYFDGYTSKTIVSSANNVIDVSSVEDKIKVNKIDALREYYDNNDINGIISIEGNDEFNYPVTQSIDNDYYLNHDYYKKYDSYGSIYADYRSDLDNSKKIIIYGHSSSKREVPFNKLDSYENEGYYNTYKYLTLETKTNTYRYEIFSVYIETNDFTYMNMNFDNKGDWYAHILGLQNKSIYSTDIVLDMDEDILILQTCSKNNNYQDYKNKYLLIVSRRVK